MIHVSVSRTTGAVAIYADADAYRAHLDDVTSWALHPEFAAPPELQPDLLLTRRDAEHLAAELLRNREGSAA